MAAMLCAALIAGCSDTNDSSTTEPPTTIGEAQDWVNAHNAVRTAAGAKPELPAVAWSEELAEVARANAKKCVFEHSKSGYGENVFASSGGATPKNVVDAWAGEKANYDLASNTCKKDICGHYTQLVWKSTARIGCAIADCAGQWSKVAFCEYDPPGNYVGQKPY